VLAVECVKWSVKPSMTMSQSVWYRRGSWQDVEKGRQLCSRLAQRLNVRPGPTHVHIGDGWAGENSLRFASSLAAASLMVFLNILAAFLVLSTRGDRLMIAPHRLRCRLEENHYSQDRTSSLLTSHGPFHIHTRSCYPALGAAVVG